MTTERFVTGDGGVQLALTEWGSATDGRPTVLLVHGYPDTSAVWEPVAQLLAPRYHVVTYDVRGAGRSTAPRRTKDYRLDHLVADMVAVADAVSPARPVHLVGHDWGSIQAWEAVTTEAVAARFASYTSIYAPGLDHVAAWIRTRLRHPSPHHVYQLMEQEMRSWYIVAFHLPGAKVVWKAGLGRRWPKVLEKVEKVAPSPTYPAATIASDGARGVALYRANFRRRLVRPHPRPTSVPVQVIVPTRDHYVTPGLSEGLERWAPDNLWRREVIAGHWLPRTDPQLVASYISQLVDHVEGDPEPPALRQARVTPQPAAGTGGGGTGRGGWGSGGRVGNGTGVGGTGRPALRGNGTVVGGAVEGAATSRRGDGGQFLRRVVVITGAGSGIGRATALAFAAEGATVVAADINTASAADTAELVRSVAPEGVEAYSRTVDVSDAESMEDLVKWVEHTFGAPDVVVNNAGIGMAGPLLDTTVAQWEQILGVNLWGVIHGCRLFGRLMTDRRRGGHIVNVASAAAYTPSRAYPAYATTKAAVLMLGDCLRGELAGSGIGVHTICPGFVDTPLSGTTIHVGVSGEEQDKRRQAVGRMYHQRGLKAATVAAAIVKAVRHGTPIVAVGAEAHLGRAASRFAPAVARLVARMDFSPRFNPSHP
jgi:NAD(P)-dependent dehydrogenase (short-subunit alcohol dehydrogenase family)/pimeloyl-ACP methyl ester carboxylesterase